MKAITIWQPWASLLACGAKQYETRSWATSYRGPIAIHAAKKNVIDTMLIPVQVKDEMKKLIGAMAGAKWENLPTGAVIATAKLVNVWHIVYKPGLDVDVAKHIQVGAESMTTDKHASDFGAYFVPSDQEFALGDWTPGRYAWEFSDMRPVGPIPAKGKQGLWTWDGME